VNTSGQVIGIPAAAATGAQGGQAQGIGFAIPANLARDIAGTGPRQRASGVAAGPPLRVT
jgi:S1-C subfamily serine protease